MNRYCWEGVDSDGRKLRAYFIDSRPGNKFASRVSLDTELPAIEFRSPMEWAVSADFLEFKRNQREAMQNLASIGRLMGRVPREPREKGTTWVRVATVSMREAMKVRSLGMSMGVANGKRRPGLLSSEQLAALLVACDRKQVAA